MSQGTGRAMVYAWTLPPQVAGGWTLTTPEGRRVPLQLRQQFQRFTGPGGVSGRLVGERIDFTLPERVNGRPMTRRFSGPRHRRQDERERRRRGRVECREGAARRSPMTEEARDRTS